MGRLESRRFYVRSSPPELRLPYCRGSGGFCDRCCWGTEMPLTEEDVARLESLGFRREEFSVVKDVVRVLRNVDGHCFFLDPSTGRCRVYEHRPLGCRLYPLVYVPGVGVDLDPECPASRLLPRSARRRIVEALAPALIELLRMVYGGE